MYDPDGSGSISLKQAVSHIAGTSYATPVAAREYLNKISEIK